MSRRSWLWVSAIIGIGVLVVVLAFVLRAQMDDRSSRRSADATSTGVSGPYDFTEAGEVDMRLVREAKFMSVTLVEGEAMRSYMVAHGHELFAQLADDVARSEEVPGAEKGRADSSLTFVLHDRRTITFVVDESTGLLWRDGMAYEPAAGFMEDLKKALDPSSADREEGAS